MTDMNPSSLSFDERIDMLAKELELAIRWQRPSSLFVVFGSVFMGAKAMAALENRLTSMGQYVSRLKSEPGCAADIVTAITNNTRRDETVFFAMNLGCGEGESVYETINNHLDFFLSNPIRIVYWMTEDDFVDLARYAPDYWSFRHRVIEFVDAPRLEHILSHVVEKTWQNSEMLSGDDEFDAEDASLRDLVLTDIREGDVTLATRARLLVTLGMLHWRQRNFNRAETFIEVALEIAEKINDAQFLTESFIAYGLVQTELKNFEAAVAAYQKAKDLAPEHKMPWNNLGNLYSRLFLFEEALEAYQKALNVNEEDPISWQGVGECHLQLGQAEKAIAAFRRAIKAAPGFANPWKGLGLAYATVRRFTEALQAFDKSLEAAHQQFDVWLERGRLALLVGQHEEAIESYQRALELDNAQPLVWNLLGNAYYAAENLEEAIKAYYKSVQIDKGFGWGYCNMALAFSKKEKFTDAVVLYEKSIRVMGNVFDRANALNKLGNVYRKQHQYVQAVRAYQLADELDAGSTLFSQYHQLPGPFKLQPIPLMTSQADSGISEADQDEILAAQRYQADDGVADNRPGTAPLGKLYPIRNPISETKDRRLMKVLESNQKARSAGYWIDLGNFYLGTGVFDMAIEAYKKAIALEPYNGWSYCNLALVYTMKGRYREAIPLYEKSIKLLDNDKDKAVSWNRLGNTYRRLNENTLAIAAYHNARMLNPENSSLASRARKSLLSNCYVK